MSKHAALIIKGRVISKKNNVRYSRGFTYKTKAWRAFESSVLAQLEPIRARFTGKVDISYTFKMKGRLDSDIDNAISAISDLLEKAGIIDNDKNVVSLTAVKEGGHKEWITEVEITSV